MRNGGKPVFCESKNVPKIKTVTLDLLNKKDLNKFLKSKEFKESKIAEELIIEYISSVKENSPAKKMLLMNKENADFPEFLLLGPFRNDILIVKNYDIQKVRKLPRKDIDRYSVNVQFPIYSVNVQFTIYDESKENGEYVRDVEYWVVLVNNKFYIYADNTLNDIYILEKDLEN